MDWLSSCPLPVPSDGALGVPSQLALTGLGWEVGERAQGISLTLPAVAAPLHTHSSYSLPSPCSYVAGLWPCLAPSSLGWYQLPALPVPRCLTTSLPSLIPAYSFLSSLLTPLRRIICLFFWDSDQDIQQCQKLGSHEKKK